MTLKTRRPTGTPSWPLILVAGEAKTGKTWSAAEFSGDERISRTFWVDLGEGCADEYGAVPGADYEIVEHDGTWIDIIGQVAEVRDVARAALEAGEPPVMLVIDSMTAEWAMLSSWTDTRARRSQSNQKALEADPDAEIDITANYWNDANSRHNRLMNILKTFPGIVVMTALETEKTQFGPNGRPLPKAPKMARPDAQKRLTADASVWVRLALDSPPTIVGMRSVRRTIQPGKDKPRPWPEFTLSKLVFDELGLASQKAAVRDTPVLNADQVAEGEEGTDPAVVATRAAYMRSVTQVRKLGTDLGWEGQALVKDYADRHNGASINDATSEQLDEYAVELAQMLDAKATS
jgi:AAA domain